MPGTYRSKRVTELTGIPAPTLRAWERRYDVVAPRRTDTGQRLYTDRDVALLRRVKSLVDKGHAVDEAVRLVRGRSAGPAPLIERLLGRMIDLDRPAVDQLLPELVAYPFERALDEIYLPILEFTGEEWARGRFSIAQEHFVSSWCREQMLGIFHALGGGPADGTRALCGLAPGERHDLGLLAIAIRLALRGCRVTWLGDDLPIAELAEAARIARPRLVCLSMITTRPSGEVVALAEELRAAIDPPVIVAVGGPCAAEHEARSTDRLRFTPTWPALQPALAEVATAA